MQQKVIRNYIWILLFLKSQLGLIQPCEKGIFIYIYICPINIHNIETCLELLLSISVTRGTLNILLS